MGLRFPLSFPWGWLWASVPSSPGCPQLCPPQRPWLPVWKGGVLSQHSQIKSLGLGAGKAGLVLFFGENIEFHARCFMYYIYNINISKSVLVSF